MKIGILETKDFSNKALNEIKDIGEVEFLKGQKKLEEFIQDKEIIFTRLNYKIDKRLLNKAFKLKYICSPTTGLNHIDIDNVKKKKIKVISLKGEFEFLFNIRATPEHAIGLILSLLRNYKYAFLNKKNREWDRDKYWGFELFRNKVGIIGFGRIGSILAKYLKSFGSNVYFYDIDSTIEELGYAKRIHSIEQLIGKSNIIILCASYTKEYDKFFNKNYIDLLKDKYFINVSRGELVEEDYLIKKIEEGYFKGIALDVIANETKKNNMLEKFLKLTKKRNFILTPHISGATYNSIHLTEEFIVEKLKNEISKD